VSYDNSLFLAYSHWRLARRRSTCCHATGPHQRRALCLVLRAPRRAPPTRFGGYFFPGPWAAISTATRR